MGRRLGLATPGSRLKPHRVDVFGRGFFDVRRHGVRPAKDDDEINRTSGESRRDRADRDGRRTRRDAQWTREDRREHPLLATH